MNGQLLAERYRVVGTSYRTTLGEAVLAEDTHRPGYPQCVIKKLHPFTDGPRTPQMVHLLLKAKIKLLARLGNSDRVPAIVDFFRSGADSYLVEAFIPGTSLTAEILPNAPWTEARAIAFLQEMLEILVIVHRQQVIHQDIQPANILRRQNDGRLVLTNFRLVEEITTPAADLRSRSLPPPTLDAPIYKAPEQFEYHAQPGSDLYAVGMIAIQALTGLSVEQLPTLRQTNGSGLAEWQWRPYAPMDRRLAALLDRLVQQDDHQRYASASEALFDLKQLLEEASGLVPTLFSAETVSGEADATDLAVPSLAIPAPQHSAALTLADSRPDTSLTSYAPAVPEVVTVLQRPNRWNPWVVLGTILLLLGGGAVVFHSHIVQTAIAAYNQQQGINKLEQKDYAGAIASLSQAIQLNGNAGEPYLQRGLAHYQAGDLQAALTDLTQTIQFAPNTADAYFYRGTVRLDLGDGVGAIQDYDRAIALQPGKALFYLNRGNALAALGQEAEAIADYTRSLERDPKLASAYVNRCLSHSNLNQQPEAIADCTQAIALRPSHAFAYQNRGLAYRRQGNWKQALADLTLAVRITPKDADPYYNRGLIRLEMGDQSGAIADFDTAIQLNPAHTLVYYDRGLARAKAGDRTNAIQDLQQAAKLCLDQGRIACYQDANYQLSRLK